MELFLWWAPSLFFIETYYPSSTTLQHASCSMKFEDFVSVDTREAALGARPLPKKHIIAISGTICIAAALSLIMPQPESAQDLPTEVTASLSEINTPAPANPAQALISYAQNQFAPSEEAKPQPPVTVAATNTASPATTTPTTSSTLQREVQRMMQPQATLTEVLTANRPTKYEATAHKDVVVAKQPQNLDNYDDLLPESELQDADSALNAKIRKLAQEENANAPIQSVPAKWYVEDIKRGDTLSSVFSDLNIPYNTMQAITSHKEAGHNLTSLRPGNTLSFLIDDDNKLVAFVKQLNKTEQLRFYRDDTSKLNFIAVREPIGKHLQDDSDAIVPEKNSLVAKTSVALQKQPESKVTNPADISNDVPLSQRRGRLVVVNIGKGQAFSSAALNAGLTYGEIDQILRLFQGRIQFSRHIQPGDSMRVLFSESKGKGKINAVEFNTKRFGKIATYRNIEDNKYYDENGYNSSSANFRRFPLNGKVRISSGFNPHRRHPVTGRVRPHNGTDFAVRIGTPVIAPADGVVVKATYSRSAGYYIVLRHRGSYSTVYMHLSKINVKPGQRVKIGSTIARSGNTGMSTGPHLHYELRRNGRPVNAMRVNLPKNIDSTVAKKQRQRFANNVKLYKRELYQESLMANL